MKDSGTSDVLGEGTGRTLGVHRLAADVMNVLASRGTGQYRLVHEPVVANLVAATVAEDPAALADLIASLRRDRLSAETIADLYVPFVARRLGEDWVSDRRSFAEVTVGTSRLQALVRQIGADWRSGEDDKVGRKTVLLHVPEAEDHTLGAVVAAGQLRRMGVSVALRLKDRITEVSAEVASRAYDALLISWASSERLESLEKIVALLRESSGGEAPIFVGGAVMGLTDRLKEKTGADFATNNLEIVAAQLGLRVAGNNFVHRT